MRCSITAALIPRRLQLFPMCRSLGYDRTVVQWIATYLSNSLHQRFHGLISSPLHREALPSIRKIVTSCSTQYYWWMVLAMLSEQLSYSLSIRAFFFLHSLFFCSLFGYLDRTCTLGVWLLGFSMAILYTGIPSTIIQDKSKILSKRRVSGLE